MKNSKKSGTLPDSSAQVLNFNKPVPPKKKAKSPSRNAPIPEQLLLGLTEIASRIGKKDFYESTLEMVGIMVNCPRQLMIRYGRYGKPELAINTSMTKSAVDFYLAKLYRLDPLLRLVKSGTTEGVMTFQELRKTEPDNLFYDELFETARIYDELAIMLSAPGGVSIALCFDRSDRRFTTSESHRARQIFPLINTMHTLHIERSLLTRRGGFYSDTEFAVMASDRRGKVIMRNDKWDEEVGEDFEKTILALSDENPNGDHFFESNEMVVVWEQLDENHAIIPSGKIHILEARQPGYIEENISSTIETFGNSYSLTNREQDCPSSYKLEHMAA